MMLTQLIVNNHFYCTGDSCTLLRMINKNYFKWKLHIKFHGKHQMRLLGKRMYMYYMNDLLPF